MSKIDDILFAPIHLTRRRSPFVDQVWQALLNASLEYEFGVQPHHAQSDYDKIAQLIDDDPHVFRAARMLVCLDNFGNLRPAGALTLSEVFARLHRNQIEFWWCCQRPGMPKGVERYKFTNRFRVVGGCPMIEMSTGTFEPWILGLLRKFLGFDGFYAFGREEDAHSYWISP